MRKIALLLLAFLAYVVPSCGQSTAGGNNADEVWAEFQKNPEKMYTFLDGITASSNPSGYKYHVQEFIKTCIDRGVDWEDLYDELKETVLPKDSSLATCYAVSLCMYAKNYQEIIKALDLIPKQHTREGYYVKGATICSDGTIVLPINSALNVNFKYGRYMGELCRYASDPDVAKEIDYEYEPQYFIYHPEGNFFLGRQDYSDKPKLVLGFVLNRQGEKIGEKYGNYNSIAEALKQKNLKEQREREAEDNRRTADADRRGNALLSAYIRKYGKRAAAAMDKCQPYVGMSEGALRDFAFASQDGNFNPFLFQGVIGAYKIYKPNGYLRILNAGYNLHLRYPSVVYVRNGRVSALKW